MAEKRPLEEEAAWFETHRKELFAAHPLKWVVVLGQKQIGIYDSFSEAFQQGSAAAGTPHVLVKQILDTDEPMSAPALTLGLLGGLHI
jgi:hypothetical protein